MGWIAMLADVLSPDAFRRRREQRQQIAQVQLALRQQGQRKSQLIGEIGQQLDSIRDTDTQMMHYLGRLGPVASRAARKS